jgi:hypothetical protein
MRVATKGHLSVSCLLFTARAQCPISLKAYHPFTTHVSSHSASVLLGTNVACWLSVLNEADISALQTCLRTGWLWRKHVWVRGIGGSTATPCELASSKLLLDE